jgi:hypothetical protein
MSNNDNNDNNDLPNEDFINPIDGKKIAQNPSLLPYAHTVGGAVIKPTEQGAIKGKALDAMAQQTDRQMQQLYDQMQVLATQAKKLQKRVEISKHIYEAEMPFEPVIGHKYCVYLRNNGRYFLSMVEPQQWGRSVIGKFEFVAKGLLLADHTWEILEETIKIAEEE